MLSKENYTQEHINELRRQTGADPSILERTVFAFGLLEAIRRVGMPFVFKGGTSLMLLLDQPRRLSTDIDIIVEPGTNVDAFIEQAGTIFPFKSVEEQHRKGANNIEKRHFMFLFRSPVTGKDIHILLDVVFESNPYIKTSKRPIKSGLLITEADDLAIRVPDKNCILGDKLTAFAPHTTGIRFGIDKELEIIKQLFDCWTHIQETDDFGTVCDVYDKVSSIEMEYRGLDLEPADCLKNTIESCICIMARGSIRNEEYVYFSSGINAIQGHLFIGRINGETAAAYACEVMYFAACILTGKKDYERISNHDSYRDILLDIKGIKKVRALRNTNPLAYAYMVKAFQMLQETGLYTKDIESINGTELTV